MLCTELSKIASDGKSLSIEPLYCKRWTCDTCNPRNHRALRAKCFDGQPNTFLTLTANPAWGHSPAHRAQRLVQAWRYIRQRWERHHDGQKIAFIAVFERTRLGEPHLHILFRGPFIPQRWIAARMRELARAPVCDIRKVRSARQLAFYLSKYLSKGTHAFAKCKRFWRSHDYRMSPREREAANPIVEHFIARMSFSELSRLAGKIGFVRVDCVGKGVVAFDFWQGQVRR